MESWQETAAELLPLGRRWDAMVRLFVDRRAERYRLDQVAYHRLHAALWQLASQGAAEPGPRQGLFAEYAELIHPWMSVGSLERTEREILGKALRRCQQIERELGRRPQDAWWWRAGVVGTAAASALLLWLAAGLVPRGSLARAWQRAERTADAGWSLWADATVEQQVLWGGAGLAVLLMTAIWFSVRRGP